MFVVMYVGINATVASSVSSVREGWQYQIL